MATEDDKDKAKKVFQAVSDKSFKVASVIMNSHKNPPIIVNHQNNSGFSTLMQAAQLVPEEDAVKFITLLLGKKAKINVQNKFGQTALMLAAKKGYGEAVQVLIDDRANYDLRTTVRVALFQCA